MTPLSHHQPDSFHNPAKMACREEALRVLREAAYRRRERLVTMTQGREG